MSKFAFFHKSGALTCDFFLYYAFNQRYCFSSKRKNSKRYGFTILDNFQLNKIAARWPAEAVAQLSFLNNKIGNGNSYHHLIL